MVWGPAMRLLISEALWLVAKLSVENVNGAVALPERLIDTAPLFPPKQETFVCDSFAVMAGPAVIVAGKEPERQPDASRKYRS